MKDPDAPPALVSHRLVILSLLHTWTHGKAINPAGSLSRRILQRFSSVATPRWVWDNPLTAVYLTSAQGCACCGHPPTARVFGPPFGLRPPSPRTPDNYYGAGLNWTKRSTFDDLLRCLTPQATHAAARTICPRCRCLLIQSS